MDEILRRWMRELRALGALPPRSALEELLRAPVLAEQAVRYAHARREQGVHTADIVRELAALARVMGPDPELLEAMARVAGERPPAAPAEDWLALVEEGLVVVDADGAVTLQSGPQPAPPELARRALSTGKPQRLTFARNDQVYESEARPLSRGAAQVFRDRSETERLRQELQRADRELSARKERLARSGHLQALAEVTAGAALALNNELNAINLALPLLRAASDESERARRLTAVEAALKRAAALVDRVQQLAAPRPSAAPRAVDLNQVLLEALDLVRPELTAAAGHRLDGGRVRVDARLGKLPPVMAQPSSLRELLSSLLVLARDALPQGGLLTIRTHADRKHGEVEMQQSAAGELDELAVEGARQLATGAEISVERVGDERVITVQLPLSESRPARGHERPRSVLVVDDDADNREALAELLSLLGHEVVAVASGREALARLTQRSFDAALLDFAMPEMNGLELARQLRQTAPRLRLALVTGWEQMPSSGDQVDAVFHKPLDLPALQRFLGDEPQPRL
jgi:CheY-like chemotaxis protein